MQPPLFGPPCEQTIRLLIGGKIRKQICGDTLELYGAGWNCPPEWATCWRCPTCGDRQPLGPEFAGMRDPVLFTLEDDDSIERTEA